MPETKKRTDGQKNKPQKAVKKQKAPKVKIKFHSGIAVLAFSLAAVIVYAAGMAGKALAKTEIPTMVIKNDVVNIPKLIDGIIIREETVVSSPEKGAVELLKYEKEKVKKGETVARIKDPTGAYPLEADLENLDNSLFELQKKRDSFSFFSPEVERINKQIKTEIDKNIYKHINTDPAGMYELKELVDNEIRTRNQIMLSENKGAASALYTERANYEAELSKYVKDVQATGGGLVYFTVDGFEEEYNFSAKDSLTAAQVNAKPEYTMVYAGKNVDLDDAVFKIVTSNEWYIAAYIDNELTDGLRANNAKTIYIETDNGYAELEAMVSSVSKGEKDSYVLFKMTKYMHEYIGLRNVRFKLDNEVRRGLKVPAEAVVDRTFIKIPEVYIDLNNKVIKITEEKDETVTVVPFRSGADSDEGYIYISLDISRLNLGDVLKRDGLPPYTISATASIRGVYTANDGITRFREIYEDDPLFSGGYYLLDPVKNPGIRSYDRIVTDASNTFDGQIIN